MSELIDFAGLRRQAEQERGPGVEPRVGGRGRVLQHRRLPAEPEGAADRLERAALGLEVVDLLVQQLDPAAEHGGCRALFCRFTEPSTVLSLKLNGLPVSSLPRLDQLVIWKLGQAALQAIRPVGARDVHLVRVRADVDVESGASAPSTWCVKPKLASKQQRRVEDVGRAQAEDLRAADGARPTCPPAAGSAAGLAERVRVVDEVRRVAVAREHVEAAGRRS